MQTESSRLVQEEISCGFRRLRFAAALENEFREHYYQSGRFLRLLLVSSTLVILLLTTAFDHRVLQTPEALDAIAHPLQRFITLPTLLLVLFFTWSSNYRKASDRSLQLAAIALFFSVLTQRVVGSEYGFDVPLEFTPTVIAAVFFLGRLPFTSFLPAAIAMTAAMLLTEYMLVQPPLDGWYRVAVACVMIALSCVGGYFFEYAMRDVWLKRKSLEYLATQDPLTGLPNRRAFDLVAERGLQVARREDRPFALAVVDVDFFKGLNDTLGHSAGDECLCELARIIESIPRRPLDCCGRYGGEEFVIAWIGTDRPQATRLTTELCEAIEAARIRHPASAISEHVTVSAGLVVVDGNYPENLSQLVAKADQALYQAKNLGRNRLVVYGDPIPDGP